MSSGYNTEFKRDPVQFMSGDWWDINSTGINGQFMANYTLDANSVGELDLFSRRANTLELRDYSRAGFFDRGWNENAIKAYYLNSRVDNSVEIQVLRHADYFFTDTLTGCTFIAYGNSRHGMVCQHVNSFTRGTVPLRQAEFGVRGRNYPVTIILNANDYRSGGLRHGEDGSNVVATVFGRRLADGWHFYARRRINSGGLLGQRSLDGAVFEI